MESAQAPMKIDIRKLAFVFCEACSDIHVECTRGVFSQSEMVDFDYDKYSLFSFTSKLWPNMQREELILFATDTIKDLYNANVDWEKYDSLDDDEYDKAMKTAIETVTHVRFRVRAGMN